MQRLVMLLLAGLVSACSSVSSAPSHFVLLGEVHDNAAGHARRLADLQAKVAAGWRPAIAMEQFDSEYQPQLSAAQQRCGVDVQCIIDAASGSPRWNWSYYMPLLALAQQYQLPLLAANLSRTQASKIVKNGFAAGLSPEIMARYELNAIPNAILELQIVAVRSGHCNQLPENILPGMARAQIARDVIMAEVMQQARRDVVLIAGNGHVRRDIGVPYWLAAHQVLSTGYLEQAVEVAHFDHAVLIPSPSRAAVCPP